MTYQQLLKQGEEKLAQAGIDDARTDAWLLLEYSAKLDRNQYYAHMDEEASVAVETDYEAACNKRMERIPLQYITGEQGFMGLTLSVNSHVLIPRQDTESLVEYALKVIEPGYRVLDLCTGSGAIAISIVRYNPEVVMVASDISKQAVLVAKENARKYDARIEFVVGNLFDHISGTFDCIVSNPPYIKETEIPKLMPEVAQFEPFDALNGGVDGLEFYRRICEKAGEHLREGGYLIVEIGHDQGEAVSAIMRGNGFVGVEVAKDLAGNDRIVSGIK